MPDIKVPESERNDNFYALLQNSIEKRHDLQQCVFIDQGARKVYWNKARFSVRVAELPDIHEKWRAGEEVASHYFLFDHGNRLHPEAVRLAQAMSLEIIPSVNTFHYDRENPKLSGLRDIEHLRKLGVRIFQIDSVYDGTE